MQYLPPSSLVDYDESSGDEACTRKGKRLMPSTPHHHHQHHQGDAQASSSSFKRSKIEQEARDEHTFSSGPGGNPMAEEEKEEEEEEESWSFSDYSSDEYKEEGETAYGNEKGTEICLLEMGFKAEHVSAAIKACGKDCSIFVISDFIQAHFGSCEGGQVTNELVYEEEDDITEGNEKDTEKLLLEMGFKAEHISAAFEACGKDSSAFIISDFLQAHYSCCEDRPETSNFKGSTQSEAAGSSATPERKWSDKRPIIEIPDPIKEFHSSTSSDSEDYVSFVSKKKQVNLKTPRIYNKVSYKKKIELKVNLPTRVCRGDMKGFGLPGDLPSKRHIPYYMEGPPFFYFENVAAMPKSQWETIKRHFNGIDPEFVDSKYFSATRRPRGYVHNLPLEGRNQILRTPPMTIAEALPLTTRYWPSWDKRSKINCLHTRRASSIICTEIRNRLTIYEGCDLPLQEERLILHQVKKWNLVWVGPGQVAPLEPHEMELLLGFDRDHTRGFSTASERYQALGNAFQVNTVAYHLSALRPLYMKGITVLSLFSGIGGAEVSLDKLGIYLKCVVVVEIDQKVRSVISSWWKKTDQRGTLILKDDARSLTNEVLVELVEEVGGFDLIIGGSPCNNLSGNNRVSRIGLEGRESSVFYEFPRILNMVKQIMQGKFYR